MAGITLAQAEAKLGEYLAAESKVLLGQSYTIDGRQLSRADLKQIQEGIALWDARAKALGGAAAGRGRAVVTTLGW